MTLILLLLWIVLALINIPQIIYRLIFNFQLLISAFVAPGLAVIGWWFKVIYEKWSNEKKAISELQQIYSHNLDTIPRLLEVLEGLHENIISNTKFAGQYIHYKNHVEYLNEVGDPTIHSLRNIGLLNNVFKSNIFIKRFNALFEKIFEEYNLITEKYKKDVDFPSLKTSLLDLDEVIVEIQKMGSQLEDDFEVSAANLRCAGEGICRSIFYKLESISGYSYTSNEIGYHLGEIKKERTG